MVSLEPTHHNNSTWEAMDKGDSITKVPLQEAIRVFLHNLKASPHHNKASLRIWVLTQGKPSISQGQMKQNLFHLINIVTNMDKVQV